jgi:Flp pilus assembly protein TadG
MSVKRLASWASERGASGLELSALFPLILVLVTGIIYAANYYYTQIALVTGVGDCAAMYSAMGPSSNAQNRSQDALTRVLSGFGVGTPPFRIARNLGTTATCEADYAAPPFGWNPNQPLPDVTYIASYRLQCNRSDWDGGVAVRETTNPDCIPGGRR